MADSHYSERFVLSCDGPRKKTNGGRFKKGQHWRKRRPFWDAAWLREEYEVKGRSASDIASQFGITETAILHWLRKHGISCRTMSEVRAAKKWGLSGSDNGMFGKTGALNPNWKGGACPERQAFYASLEWKAVARLVRKRDRRTCRRCGLPYQGKAGVRFHIHHIVSFAVVELRAGPDNLILLCHDCHSWVHSKGNISKEYLKGKEV